MVWPELRIVVCCADSGPGSIDDNASDSSSKPILPERDDDIMTTFPNGKARDENSENVICIYCSGKVLKRDAKEHIVSCLKSEQEKTRKKEAREAAQRVKEKAYNKEEEEDAENDTRDGDKDARARQSAVTSTGVGGEMKKGKKRKADIEDDDIEKQNKKEGLKLKVRMPKPVDVERQTSIYQPYLGGELMPPTSNNWSTADEQLVHPDRLSRATLTTRERVWNHAPIIQQWNRAFSTISPTPQFQSADSPYSKQGNEQRLAPRPVSRSPRPYYRPYYRADYRADYETRRALDKLKILEKEKVDEEAHERYKAELAIKRAMESFGKAEAEVKMKEAAHKAVEDWEQAKEVKMAKAKKEKGEWELSNQAFTAHFGKAAIPIPYTISEDRTGSPHNIMMQRLSALRRCDGQRKVVGNSAGQVQGFPDQHPQSLEHNPSTVPLASPKSDLDRQNHHDRPRTLSIFEQ
jgi:hypothetical protein